MKGKAQSDAGPYEMTNIDKVVSIDDFERAVEGLINEALSHKGRLREGEHAVISPDWSIEAVDDDGNEGALFAPFEVFSSDGREVVARGWAAGRVVTGGENKVIIMSIGVFL